MRTKISLGLLIISALTIASCKKELEPQESSTAVRATEATNPNKTASATPLQQSTIQTPTNNSTLGTTVGINPAHGQPGHRCDIAVGAPVSNKNFFWRPFMVTFSMIRSFLVSNGTVM